MVVGPIWSYRLFAGYFTHMTEVIDMLGTICSLGVGLCVDTVLKIAVPAGKTVGSKIVRTIGTAAISYAVGQEIDRAFGRVEDAVVKIAAAKSNVEIIEEEGNGDE